ncbi:hypothetical protein OUZ56_010151 [Daphnia magna]|uniref:Uncharacterized protein n=1 Tax=Daphnia magna TaxID=35525 RepID=A0ABR0AI61_9CRUS|nr:hypothetical protein OUZ56_010151 [Daphnia magna]
MPSSVDRERVSGRLADSSASVIVSSSSTVSLSDVSIFHMSSMRLQSSSEIIWGVDMLTVLNFGDKTRLRSYCRPGA